MRTPLLITSIAAIALTVPGMAAAAEPELVSHDDDGVVLPNSEDPAVSGDGTRVAYSTETQNDGTRTWTVRVLDRTTGKNILTQQLPGDRVPEIDLSADGRTLAIKTDDVPISPDPALSLYDVDSGTATPLPEDFYTMTTPHVSANGQWIAFSGRQTNTSSRQAYRWNVRENKLTQVTEGGAVQNALISGDGRTIAYKVGEHSYSRKVATGSWMRVDTLPGGQSLDGASIPTGISDSGNYVLFASDATMGSMPDACGGNSGECIWRKQLTGARELQLANEVDGAVAPVPGWEYRSELSGDGRVATYATTRGYVRAYRFTTDTNAHVSTNSQGGLRPVYGVSITRDGSAVSYALTTREDTYSTAWINDSGI